MLATHREPSHDGPLIDQLLAADVHDDLLTASEDLDRLQLLLSGACEALAASFFGANEHMDGLRQGDHDESVQRVTQHLVHAITALQFQDLASQLIAHTHSRLRDCAGRLAADGHDHGGHAASRRSNPVAQHAMRPGTVELF